MSRARSEGQIMTEVQNFSHYAINKFPCFKVAIAEVEEWRRGIVAATNVITYTSWSPTSKAEGRAPCNGHISAVQTAPN